MIRIFGFLVILVFHGVHAQLDCIPERVANVSIDLNYVLRWIPSTNCEVTQYEIFIYLEENVHYVYQTEDPYLDVNFLPACERFSFKIRAFSEHMLSDESGLDVYMPAPSETVLTIDYVNATGEGRSLSLNWTVNQKYAHCARAFRVVIQEDWYIRDVYTQTNSLSLDNLVPCVEYVLTVAAIYSIQLEGPIQKVLYRVPVERTPPPVLRSVSAAPTYVNATFALIGFELNNCRITALRISGTSLSRTFEIQDSHSRPEVTVQLTPLLADTMYYLGVFVVNIAGTSDPLQIAIHTLPVG